VHRTLLTNHIHEFEEIRRDGIVREDMIEEAYPKVRRKFERLVKKFREHLATSGDFLYVTTNIRPEPQVRHLIDLLAARCPEHRIHLLFVPFEGEVEDLSGLAGQVSIAHRPRESGKGPGMVWEGHDAAWDAALAPFKLSLDFGEAASAKPVAKADDADLEASAPRGLLARLFGR
jgi:hypothetical protein